VTAELVEVSDAGPQPSSAFLSVNDLRVHFPTADGVVKSVDGLTFTVERGQTLGIVGESGSGKSVTSQAILGLHKGTRAQISGAIWLDGKELISASESDVRALRGSEMAMIFQDPLSALHPYYTIGKQISEAYLVHNHVSRSAAKKRSIEMLDLVGIPNAAQRFSDYPHQFSGGMRQRAMIAMALVNDPKLLIADEPTTALDVTVQAQILELMKTLQREFNSAIILITHDLGVVAETCDSVVVMYGGQCVETGPVDELFYSPEMAYTWGLLGSMPRMDRLRQTRLMPIAGQPPSLINVPPGCVFHPRCIYKDRVPGNRCSTEHPDLLPTPNPPVSTSQLETVHQVRCHIEPTQRRQIWTNEIAPVL
jgi:peptide/nickel transport system ATP-binding protein